MLQIHQIEFQVVCLNNLFNNIVTTISSKTTDNPKVDLQITFYKISNFVFASGQLMIQEAGYTYNCKVPNDFLPKKDTEFRGQVITRNDKIFTNAVLLSTDGLIKSKNVNTPGEVIVFSCIYELK